MQLLSVSRRLFVHSWYHCDFLTAAANVAGQAVEAALRVLYPTPGKASFETLINRAQADGYLSHKQAETAHDIRGMRNRLSHPLTKADLDALPTVNLIGHAHEIVARIMTLVNARDAAEAG